MLFTMFMISPQLEAAAAVIARGLGLGARVRGSGTRAGRKALTGTGGCLEEAASREGGGGRQPTHPARSRSRFMAASTAHSLSRTASVSPRPDPEEPPGANQAHLRPASRPAVAHTSAFRGLLRPEVTARRRGRGSRNRWGVLGNRGALRRRGP